MPAAGFSFGAVAESVDIGGGGTAWSDLSAIWADDTSYASVTLAVEAVSQYLLARWFNFAIPSDATINGIEVKGNQPSGPNASVYLTKDGTSIAGTSQGELVSGGGDTIVGGSANLWGTTWTPSEVNANTFGGMVRVVDQGFGSSSEIDFLQVRVTYTEATLITDEPSTLRVQSSILRW